MVQQLPSYIHGTAAPLLYTWYSNSPLIYMVQQLPSYIHGTAAPLLYGLSHHVIHKVSKMLLEKSFI